MEEFELRLQIEYSELTERISKLEDFINSTHRAKLSKSHEDLLMIQYMTMQSYAQILHTRLLDL
jgi:hypothetical protein